MKRLKFATIIVVVICCVLYMTGCASDTNQNDGKIYDESLICEAISEDGTYTDEYGSYDYKYHIPQIVSESEEAKDINEKIMKGVGADAKKALKAIENKDFPLSSSISWSAAWKGSMLSLLIKNEPSAGAINYTLYNFDFKKEKSVDNSEIFKMLDITEEEFLSAAKKSASERMTSWDDEGADFEKAHVKMFYEGVYPLNVTTLQKIDSKTAKLYVADNNVKMVLEGFVPAGGGTYSELITLDFEKKEQQEKTVEYKGITASLKNGKVFVQYDGEAVDWIDVGSCLVDDDQLIGEKEYEVSGCYRDYKDIFISQAGEAQNAYLYLLTEDGDLEMVNLIKGGSAGVVSAIPIPYLKNIDSVKETVDKSKDVWSYAVDKEGEKYDLSLYADVVEKSPHQFLTYGYIYKTNTVTHKDGDKSYENYFELEFHNNGKVDIYEFVDGKTESLANYSGTMIPLGGNDEGTIYYFELENNKGKEIYLGSFLIRNVMTMDDYGGIDFDKVEIKVNTGVDILKTHGEWLKIISTNTVG